MFVTNEAWNLCYCLRRQRFCCYRLCFQKRDRKDTRGKMDMEMTCSHQSGDDMRGMLLRR